MTIHDVNSDPAVRQGDDVADEIRAQLDQSEGMMAGANENSLRSLIDNNIVDERGDVIGLPPLPPGLPSFSGVFDVYVEARLHADVAEALNDYALGLKREGYTVAITPFDGTAAQLREHLADRWSNEDLEGALFVGDLPVQEFQSLDSFSDNEEVQYPHDLFFMDLDGTYDFDAFGPDSHTGDVAPEIYVSRVTASTVAGGVLGTEAEIINSYFDKVSRVRSGELTYEDRAIQFNDDDWASSFVGMFDALYDDVSVIQDTESTTRDAFLNMLGENVESVFEAAHSWPSGHSLKGTGGGIITSAQVAEASPQMGFLNMFNCSSADFTVPNNLISTYLHSSDFLVNAVGSAKTGSMLSHDRFYDPQAYNAGAQSVGQAFQTWFDLHAGATDIATQNWRIDWFNGMTMQGDPTLTPASIPLPAFRLSRGDATFEGNRANEIIEGLNGDDVISGAFGADQLFGDGGDDDLDGGAGFDILKGNSGDDTLRGGAGDDSVYGGIGSDRLFGGNGEDLISGNHGRDMLFGGDGDDLLRGGGDDDRLVGGFGNDVMNGGKGADWFVFNEANFGRDRVNAFQDGVDLFIVDTALALSFGDLTIDRDSNLTSIGFGGGSIDVANVGHNVIDADDFIFMDTVALI